MPNPTTAGAHVLRRALIAGIDRVVAEQDGLNRINVFPVPDGDTGTNLGFTLACVRDALRRFRGGSVASLFACIGSEAIDGARGNSGAILAQFLQGIGEGLQGRRRLALGDLAVAVEVGAGQARQAIAEPREGTMLSVIQAFAEALRHSMGEAGAELRSGFATALAATRNALADTPRQLPVLRKAGVVDAGAQGFVYLLEGVQAFIETGRALAPATQGPSAGESGVVIGATESDAQHRWCSECVLSASAIDRAAVRAALDGLEGSSLVLAGTREKLRVHMHVDDPQHLFECLGAFGEVSARKADDMQAQQRLRESRSGVAVVFDSAADVPEAVLESLPLQMVPVRLNFGASDYLDKVSLSAEDFYAMLKTSAATVRTSQPPPGDFRRLFEFLLSHHAEVVYVGVSRALSGTLQAGESAAAALGDRVQVIDSGNVSAGQGLLVRHAGERAAAGADAATIRAEIEALRAQTRTFAYVRDLTCAVRGGRVPSWSLPLTRWLGLVPVARIGAGDGRLRVAGVGRDRPDLPVRFVQCCLRGLDRSRDWRAQVLHCDNPHEAERVRAALLDALARVECAPVFAAGSAIGAHAGPGAVVLALMPASA